MNRFILTIRKNHIIIYDGEEQGYEKGFDAGKWDAELETCCCGEC